MNEARSYNLDVLRIIAAFMVVMIHVSGYFLIKTDLTLFDTYFVSVFSSLVRSAVPLFFMISGVVFLNPTKDFTVKYLINKIVRLLIIYIVWNLLYALIDTWNHFTFYEFVKRIWKGHFHMWFFEYMIGVYILIPVLKGLVAYKNGKFVLYYVIVFFIWGILKSTCNAIPFYQQEIALLTSKIHVELVDFCGYFVLGYYLSTIKVSARTIKPIYLSIYLSMVALQYLFIVIFKINFIGVDAFSIFVALEALALFMLLYHGRLHVKPNKTLLLVSKATLGVYLIHPFFLENLPLGFLETVPIVFALPMLFVIISIISFLFSLIMNKIPYVNKWLV